MARGFFRRRILDAPRELQAAATKRMTIDLQIDGLNGLASDDPPLPFPHTSQIDGPLRKLAKALDTHLVYGFQDEAPDSKSRRTPKREWLYPPEPSNVQKAIRPGRPGLP